MRRRLAFLLPAWALTLIGLAAPPPSAAAVDMFLKVEGIDGESVDKGFAKQIDVLAWSWGVSRSGATRTRSAGARSQDLSITKFVDKASIGLYDALARGRVIPTAKLSARKVGATAYVFFEVCLADVQVRSLSTGGSGGEDRFTENIVLSAGAVALRYSQQRSDGSVAPSGTAGFDFTQNPASPVSVPGC